ncbi:MAG: hypothetical protein CO186_11450 [Zetaproteobacteria bacterium CG_4_9_14_3_um_filter_49_83]|nr:MAG: hypothetical protein AUJ56_12080 [Zetaproteobacteria bacterium CG1_02_49_23]PIQ31756.1 MAG: hypothetical protein COW62_08830 [Zetaproteobacteria bacterium CG17_big_fil_post_rev_8_21_14_2_50_50_13]PIV29551.1 MAG: hypothetical protein COS35_11495 [Zetaproteobacteria bacterium CG02_land_8_20_14_3_00_50_9]PIY56627.1 MAG: hypothetical protein COZ00_03075 [Zetaproteobacteria bacterium CG_4_10_14_0_8_um_filter_49_80]PJA34182.1 MAG: hypothetical protein CO186_11450 [Zetaproteobacteria bacterium
MNIHQHTFSIATRGRGIYPVSRQIQNWVREQKVQQGLLNLFVQHTSCSFIIQENADPDVLRDMEMFMQRLVPDGDPQFRHIDEGPDDMSAHIRMALTQVSLQVPVQHGRLALGTWQGIYLYEHRLQPMNRHICLTLIG